MSSLWFILLFVLVGYFVGRTSTKKRVLYVSLSIGVISIITLYLLVKLSYFDVPGHKFTFEDYFEVIKGVSLTFCSILVGGAIGFYFKNQGKKRQRSI